MARLKGGPPATPARGSISRADARRRRDAIRSVPPLAPDATPDAATDTTDDHTEHNTDHQ